MKTNLSGKTTYRREARYRQQAEGAVRPKYLRIQAACIYAGISRQLLYQWIADGSVHSVLVKSFPDSRSGMRMVDVQSIDDHISSFSQAAQNKSEASK